jgi:hypothetical protein
LGKEDSEVQPKITPAAQKEQEASGIASGWEETKTQSSDDARHPAKSLESSIPDMSAVIAETANLQSDERSQQSSTAALDSVTRAYISRSDAREDKPFTVETSIDDPPKTAGASKPRPSPLLSALADSILCPIYQAGYEELEHEIQVFSEKEEYQREQARQRMAQKRKANPEEQREKHRLYMREYRARKRREADSQQAQETETS